MELQRDILPGVHGLGSSTINWYLVEDEGRLTAVDAGLPGFRDRIEGDLAALGRSLGDVNAVVLTHSDSDHTGLAAVFARAGARVLISSADEPALRTGKVKKTDGSPVDLLRNLWRPDIYRFVSSIIREGGARPTKIQGAETFSDGAVLDVPGSPRVVATPGHTVGHCALYFEGHGALFVGDEMCTLNPLTGDQEPQVMPALVNVSTPQCFESLGRIESLQADGVLFGHGEPWRGGVAAAVTHARAAGPAHASASAA